MGQMAKGFVNEQNMTLAQEPLTEEDEELDTVDIGKQLERVKWFLWYGNVLPARREDFNGLRGVRGESSGEQADGKEAANAME
jgi:hypothetical protein